MWLGWVGCMAHRNGVRWVGGGTSVSSCEVDGTMWPGSRRTRRHGARCAHPRHHASREGCRLGPIRESRLKIDSMVLYSLVCLP